MSSNERFIMTGDPTRVHPHPSAVRTPFFVRPAVRPDREPDAFDALRDRLADRIESFAVSAQSRLRGLWQRSWRPMDLFPVRFLRRRLRAFYRDFDGALWREDNPRLEQVLIVAFILLAGALTASVLSGLLR